ncbi:MAG TPA: phosphoribosylamine--glycine ligase [Methanomassiliicoccales archaeon]|nr:phosphoribosylamine--glycine ligase [Methanomassiliicoccales archaeon]
MTVKVLVVGGGGREHAIVRALVRSGAEVYAAMKNRNPGIARAAKEFALVKETDVPKVTEFALKAGVEMAVIGPESPLEAGLTDTLVEKGIGCVGPSRAAARIETSKSFARALLKKHRIPGNIEFHTFDDALEAKKFIMETDKELAVKPVGLTGGKGVKIQGEHLKSKDEVLEYVREIFEKNIGGAGVVLEERLQGEEFTLQAFCDGRSIATMPLVQDHKRAFEGDVGPNTGGMGSYSSEDHLLPFVERGEVEAAKETMRRTVRALADEGFPYRGVLYGQFMLTADGPKVIEFNARFGDPEAMNVLSVMSSSFVEASQGIIDGTLSAKKVEFARKATVCKYVVPEGYGIESKAGLPIRADERAIERENAVVYYAAVNEENGKILTGTSRALGVVGMGDSIEQAEASCERALKYVSGEAIYVRHDIGRKEIIEKKVERMRRIRKHV